MTQEVKYEFIHGCYVQCQAEDSEDDAVFVKRYRINPDGSRVPELHMHKNVPRDFWITKKRYQTYTSKLECEDIDKLDRYTTTERFLTRDIARRLGRVPNSKDRLRMLCRSPHVWGCDLDITSVVKLKYKKRWDVVGDGLQLAVQDIETDVNGDLGLIIFSMSYKNRAYQTVLRQWVNDPNETEQDYIDYISEVLPEIKERNITLELDFVDSPTEAIIKMYKKANEWMPDIISFWNINFDIPYILNELKKTNTDPAYVFSHPSVPPEYKFFQWAPGSMDKKKDDGSSRPLHFSEQWHTIYTPAPFYFIDQASLFRTLRRTKAESSYALEYVTTKYVGVGKYKKEHEALRGVPEGTYRWHQIMQRRFKKDYCAYGLIDCIRLEQLDENEKDVKDKLLTLAKDSHFKDFNSNPRRLCNQLHSFFLERGKVVATTSDRMEEEIDKLLPSKEGWISILEAAQIEDVGLQIVKEGGWRRSKATIHNADLDIISTYPMVGLLLGIWREGTMLELCEIKGIDGIDHRYLCVNYTGGRANAVLICQKAYGLDGLAELHLKFAEEHNLVPYGGGEKKQEDVIDVEYC